MGSEGRCRNPPGTPSAVRVPPAPRRPPRYPAIASPTRPATARSPGRASIKPLREPHFVLTSGDYVFKQTAPIIKLPQAENEDAHFALLAYLNSSTACFYLRETCKEKGGSGVGRGVQDEPWEERQQFGSEKLGRLPLPPNWRSLASPGRAMDELARQRQTCRREFLSAKTVAEREAWETKESDTFSKMVRMQEEIDFIVYALFGLSSTKVEIPLSVGPGHRFFEVDLAREVTETAWFERHNYARPHADAIALRDLNLPEQIGVLERPEYKRRWTAWNPSEEARKRRVAETIEEAEQYVGQQPIPVRLRGAVARAGLPFVEDGESDVSALVADESVPYLAAYRFTTLGIEKFCAWQSAWDQQRCRPNGDLATTPLPLEYEKKDYVNGQLWRLRGELDVPHERFISYPDCESDEDKVPIYGWAGWNHLQQALALAKLYMKRVRPA